MITTHSIESVDFTDDLIRLCITHSNEFKITLNENRIFMDSLAHLALIIDEAELFFNWLNYKYKGLQFCTNTELDIECNTECRIHNANISAPSLYITVNSNNDSLPPITITNSSIDTGRLSCNNIHFENCSIQADCLCLLYDKQDIRYQLNFNNCTLKSTNLDILDFNLKALYGNTLDIKNVSVYIHSYSLSNTLHTLHNLFDIETIELNNQNEIDNCINVKCKSKCL